MVELKLDENSFKRFKAFSASFVGEDAESKAMQTLLDSYDRYVELAKTISELNAKIAVTRSRFH